MIYVIGGSGFVGVHLYKKLIELNYDVTVCDIKEFPSKSRINFIKLDLRDIDEIKNLSLVEDDIVINIAANQYHNKVPKNKYEYFKSVNEKGTHNLLEVMLASKCRNLIFFTTDMTYGKPQYLPLDENHPQNPFGPYGLSKKNAEYLCKQYREKGFNITIFRPRLINGPGRLGILQKLFKLIEMGLPVPTIGNGKNHYQMISVFDCVSAIIASMEAGIPNGEYNLGSIDSPNINNLLWHVIKKTNSKSFVLNTPGSLVKMTLRFFEIIGMPIMYKEQYMIADEEYIVDITRAQRELKWEPKYNDLDMILEAYNQYVADKQ